MGGWVRLVLVGGLLVGFGVLAWAARGESVLRGDVRFAYWVQGRDWPGLDPLMETANWSARSVPVVIAAAVIAGGLARKRRLDEAVVLVAAVVIMHASYALKELIASPRPTSGVIRVPDAGGGFGFPAEGRATWCCFWERWRGSLRGMRKRGGSESSFGGGSSLGGYGGYGPGLVWSALAERRPRVVVVDDSSSDRPDMGRGSMAGPSSRRNQVASHRDAAAIA